MQVKLAGLTTKEKVVEFQKILTQLPQIEDIEKDTANVIAGGMYARMLFRKKGTVIVGKVHKKEHMYMVMQGSVLVTTDGPPVQYDGPCIIACKPGTKRAVYALTDATCTYIARTDLDEVNDELEKESVEEDENALFDAHNRLKFDVPKFRELTKSVIANEKVGFWSDWTTEQQQQYTSGDWLAFSKSRGYSDEQIQEYSLWRDMIAEGIRVGFNPYVAISDLTTQAAERNIGLDSKGEILKSSHLPFQTRSKV